MVEKVSEVSMSVAIKGDSTPDDNALLKHIAKKKKQDEGGENISLAAMLPPGALVRLTTPLAQGGGLQKTEKQAAKEISAASLGLAADARQTKKGDGLRQQVALAVAGQMAKPNAGKNAVVVQKGEVTGPLSNGAAASASRTEGQSTAPVAVNVAANTLVDAATKLHQSATAQHPQAAAVVNPVIVAASAPAAEAGRQEKPLRIKEDSGEARPLWQGAKQPENVAPKQGEVAAQSKNSPTTLQQLKNQAGLASGVKGGNEGQTLEVNYQFQRWSGDHSVKISVPTEARREGNVTLLPSDARAADVLLRNMGHLTGLSPDLLRPQQERDEQQQQRRQQQQQDEDQE
ncbi:SpaN/EivJ family type III secretion system needle length determinant [Dryocola sp. BD626]|uniref:SpaN/EivJ family type III secretion system needle length determinant n=1 Tax=Dryocola sp. BD626 TaxID=3133273 RepID=UPI003F4F8A2C